MNKKNWLLLLILLLLLPFLLWLVFWTHSGQTKLETQQVIEQVIELLPGKQRAANTTRAEETNERPSEEFIFRRIVFINHIKTIIQDV